jgi:membrane-associated protease RseP (regulator of RpoE activity)
MRRLLSLVFLAAVAVPAAAQETPSPRERDTTRVREHGFQYFYGPGEVRVEAFQRGRLGILVDLTADPARDSIGARVAGLTPGGAAGKAGVQVGDLVVRLNGTALVRRAGRNEGGDEEEAPSRPGTRLIELASRLEPGDSVRLELRRGTQPVNVVVVAGESGMDEMSRTFRMELPRGDGPVTRSRVPMPKVQAFTFSGGPFADIELVKVNPGLAEYFGTSEGLLVVNVGDDSTFGLRNGDVILAIGGRKPTSPAQALRILGTYEPNESVSFDVMRMKHRASVSGKMPARRARTGWSVTPNSFDFDMPDVQMPFMQGMDEMQQLPKIMLRRPSGRTLPKVRTRVVTT